MKITCTDPYDGTELSVDDDSIRNDDGAGICVEITYDEESLHFCFESLSEIHDFINALSTMKSRLADYQHENKQQRR